jgi:hypothetical protein
MQTRIQHFRSMRIGFRIQGFDDQKVEKNYSFKKKLIFSLIRNTAIYCIESYTNDMESRVLVWSDPD